MNVDWEEITHVTKVDPAKELPSDLSVLEGTDLILVGGSDDVTEDNTLETIDAIREAVTDLPVFQEPYDAAHVSRATFDRVDALAVPAVYNGDRDHFVGKHVDLFAEIGRKPDELLGTSVPVVGDLVASRAETAVSDLAAKIVGEGYVVQHRESAAAAVSGVGRTYTTDEVAGAALATETFYDFPIFYVEYSGTYGGPGDVEAAARYLEETTLLYGGGIDSAEKATEILSAGADAVVVGDCFHDDPATFLETIPSR
ncbi:heptaprenylglyceryl phosphate synthase [Natrarchaeobius oligotrophus]|uniref:Geranylgeranylglyceryl phosphate synthase n=1 Tax=Natrarchaeobius chitinivorans TaxID=1679083 RepID=A0A3N6N5T0_NATCH|nr:heptaprenylglyceryl phosphate synthase [Natrarchaeobius chitinivorans]RQH03217.1 heptaprenylglyceryl phosphate synthase [Natrarchaeobius chitinivorans]